MNLAITSSQTDYCINYNTDDMLYPAALSSLMMYAASMPEIDVFYSRFFVSSDVDHRSLVTVFDKPEYSHDAMLKVCLCGAFPLLKRKSVIEAGLFDTTYRIAGDYELWLRMSKFGYRFRKIPEAVGCYFLNPAGLSTNQDLNFERNSEVQRLREKHR